MRPCGALVAMGSVLRGVADRSSHRAGGGASTKAIDLIAMGAGTATDCAWPVAAWGLAVVRWASLGFRI